VIVELACLLLAVAISSVIGAALGTAFEEGPTGSPYLPLSWMMWIGVTACAVTADTVFRKAGCFALSGVLLTSFVGSSIAAVLLLVPLFVSYCGTQGFWCASAEPHDLLDFYGTMAAAMPVYAAILALPLLALTRPREPPRVAAPESAPAPPRTRWQAILWLVVLISLTGVYFEITQVLNFY
jgi:hypothetical protein